MSGQYVRFNGDVGMGLMRFTWTPELVPQQQAFDAILKAIEMGCQFFNSGEFYGNLPDNATDNLKLLKAFWEKYPETRDKMVLSVKGGVNMTNISPDSSKENIERSINNILSFIPNGYLDIFECARVDPNVEIEDVISYITPFIEAGKVGGIALSECGAETINRAAKVHKISGVEVEYSISCRHIVEIGVAKACADNGIAVIAYSPLGSGLLTGKHSEIDSNDMRSHFDKFKGDNLKENLKMVKIIEDLAKEKHCTSAQLSLAWIVKQSGRNGMPRIVPIPGCSSVSRVEENLKVVDLSDEEFERLDGVVQKMNFKGARYMKGVNLHLDG